MVSIQTAKYYKAEIMSHMHLTLLKTKICLFLNLMYVIWTKRFNNIIDIVRIFSRLKTSCTRV